MFNNLLNTILNKQKGLSTFLKLPLDLTSVDKILAVSVDRIDNNLDYVKGNITLVTRFENMGRGNNDFDTFLSFCKSLKCENLETDFL